MLLTAISVCLCVCRQHENKGHVIDATDFLKGEVDIHFDLIMVYMAMSHSVSPLLVQPGFWTYSLKHLKSSGVMCVNLWKGAEHRFEWIFNRLGSCLKTPPVVLRHRQIDNMVVVGLSVLNI